ncbi:GH17868 [Drosophila grimshawi]|uniref:GH17868 n=1 Tax=Drosophila grimshawi TaxID=7222 RepID=B4JX18_DROGR|nr:GH17868 [Drosophila grimshawi]
MDFCKDMRSLCWNDSGEAGFIVNMINAAGAISQLRLQSLMENVKPLQQMLINRHYGTIIVGGLATGAMLYLGHRWLTDSNVNQRDPGWSQLKQLDTGKNTENNADAAVDAANDNSNGDHTLQSNDFDNVD